MSDQNTEAFTRTVKPVVENVMDGLLVIGFKLFMLAIGLIAIIKIIEIIFRRRK